MKHQDPSYAHIQDAHKQVEKLVDLKGEKNSPRTAERNTRCLELEKIIIGYPGM